MIEAYPFAGRRGVREPLKADDWRAGTSAAGLNLRVDRTHRRSALARSALSSRWAGYPAPRRRTASAGAGPIAAGPADQRGLGASLVVPCRECVAVNE